MTSESQQSSGGPNCLTVLGVLTLVMLVVMLVLGLLAWNAVGSFFGGISQGITGLGESVGGAVGQTLEDLGETVDGIGQGVTDLGESVAALPESISTAVEDAFSAQMSANIETRNVLAHAVTHMGTLVTTSQTIEEDVQVDTSGGLLNRCWATVDHQVVGTIEAGVDLSQVQGSDFTHDIFLNSWVLKLGTAKIHSCRIDYIRQTEFQTGPINIFCEQNRDEFRLLAETAVLPELRKEALAEGLLAEAELEAQRVLGNFMRAVTGSDNVTIVFESEPVTEFPESCLREPPPEWRFDEDSDSWLRE